MDSGVDKFGGAGLFDVGVVSCVAFSLRRVSTNDYLSPGSDANLDIKFIGRYDLQTVKFVLHNRDFTRPLDVCDLWWREISRSEGGIIGRGRTIAVTSTES